MIAPLHLAGEPGSQPRPFDRPRAERAVRELLAALGEDPDREGLLETPARVARAYQELVAGLHDDAARHLGRVFSQRSEDLVTLSDIEFTSLCEHHLLPVTGRAHIAYLPANGQVVGLSKLARTVDVFARRPQMQERLTAEIADAIVEHLDARGALVVVEGEHSCLALRGAAKRGATMRTVAARGWFERDAELRAETLALLLGRGR
jgi:GTP cyclohydrolase IA